MDIDYDDSPKFPVRELGLAYLDRATDIHPHTNYTDGTQGVQDSIEEARSHGLWEKGAIEHANRIDEDIVHVTGFLTDFSDNKQVYSSRDVFPLKYENLEEIAGDDMDTTLLNDADREKLGEDVETLNYIQERGEASYEDLVNYKMVIPHGVELDYNPAIEAVVNGDEREAVESYEQEILDFLRDAESLNSGFNYALLSSHYVNTPFRPRYVKKEGLFEDMSLDERKEVLEAYRDKEIYKIDSLAERMGEMEVPAVSGELMRPEEMDELEEFIYGQKAAVESAVSEQVSNEQIRKLTDESLDIERPGVLAVGAHPTLIERNEELMDVFREDEGLDTREDIRDELESFMYDTALEGLDGTDLSSVLNETVSTRDVDEVLSEEDFQAIYPAESLLDFYSPMVDAADRQDNFIFEVNGKGVERQVPSVFWYMLDEKVFGSDAHRPMEQPERSQIYSESDLPGHTVLLSEKWLEQLEDREEASGEDPDEELSRDRATV